MYDETIILLQCINYMPTPKKYHRHRKGGGAIMDAKRGKMPLIKY